MKQFLFVLALAATLVVAACSSNLAKVVKDIPPFGFESWSHTDHYGVFTDSVILSGAKWALNSDGSATLNLEHYDGDAAWAGSVGLHDVIRNLIVNFPPDAPQAKTLAHFLKASVPFSP